MKSLMKSKLKSEKYFKIQEVDRMLAEAPGLEIYLKKSMSWIGRIGLPFRSLGVASIKIQNILPSSFFIHPTF